VRRVALPSRATTLGRVYDGFILIYAKTLKKLVATAATALISTLLTLAALESGLRLAYLPDPWTARNFSVDAVNQQVTNLAIQYDPVLGYVTREDYRGGVNSHGRMGVRLNQTLKPGDPLPEIPQGGILATGDSFTFGSEVADAQSWPARLEAELGGSVVNGGAGGYGIDQAILRAEQLLDVVKPKAIIVSFIPNNVGRDEYSINQGLIKPYFDLEDGKLVLKGVPVPDYQPSRKYAGWARTTFGRSYLVYWSAERLGLRSKWLLYEGEVRVAHNRGVEVSCLLWGRLAEKLRGRDVKLIALAQYAGIQVNGHDNSRDYYKVPYILDCAKRAGYLVVDSYPELRRRFEADEAAFWQYWVRQPHDEGRIWNTGHMSAQGNQLTANLLAAALREHMPEVIAP